VRLLFSPIHGDTVGAVGFGSMSGPKRHMDPANTLAMDPGGGYGTHGHRSQKAYVFSDDRSLYAEVLLTGAIVWRFRYRLNGKREKLTLGKYPALTLKKARLRRDEAAELVAMGESPARGRTSRVDPMERTR